MSKNTAISVSVSVDTSNAIKNIISTSKFIQKMNKEGLIVEDTSKLLRLAIVHLIASDTSQIKKSIKHSSSDENMLSFLRQFTLEEKCL
jgi:hypothetical protein